MENPAHPHQPKTLYDSSVGEIALKNFFAGFMHGLGGFMITLISWALIYYVFTSIILPQMSDTLGEAKALLDRVDKVNSLVVPQKGEEGETQTNEILIPPGILEQLQKMQKAQ